MTSYTILASKDAFVFVEMFGGCISLGWGGSMISIILHGEFCALAFTRLITFFREPNNFVIKWKTLLIKRALGLCPEPFHSNWWLLPFLECSVNELR